MVPLLEGAFLRMPACYSDGIDTRVVLLRRRTVSESVKIKSTDSGKIEDLDHSSLKGWTDAAQSHASGDPSLLAWPGMSVVQSALDPSESR